MVITSGVNIMLVRLLTVVRSRVLSIVVDDMLIVSMGTTVCVAVLSTIQFIVHTIHMCTPSDERDWV